MLYTNVGTMKDRDAVKTVTNICHKLTEVPHNLTDEK
jgi:hypothetical protein